MLDGRRPHPTIPTSDLARARAWYAEKLGLTTDLEEAAALLYRNGQDPLFLLFSSPDAGTAEHQLAAWEVDDLPPVITGHPGTCGRHMVPGALQWRTRLSILGALVEIGVQQRHCDRAFSHSRSDTFDGAAP